MLSIQFLLAFLLSVLTAYIDLTTFFQQKARFRVWPLAHIPSLIFFAFNGALASLLMYIAIDNKLITENHWTLAFISGLGTAGLLRSKFFTFGEDNKEFGFEFIYNFIKNQAIARLANDSGSIKIRLSFQLADQYKDKIGITEKMDNVAKEIIKLPNWDEEKRTKFNGEYKEIKNDPTLVDIRGKVAAIIRVFIDYSSIRLVKDYLKNFGE